MPPPTLACPTCHKRFFKSSLAIHAKKCKAHFEKSHVNCPDCELTCSKELFRKHECDPGLKKRVKERRERERAQAKRAAEEKRKLEKATKKANQEANAVCGSCGLSKKVMMEEVEQEWRQRQKIKLQALLPSFQNNIAPTCDECETKKSVGFCVDCEQNMCQDCSERIHNKGARKR